MPIDMEMSTTISAIDNEVSSTDIEMLAKQRQTIISMTKETILEAQNMCMTESMQIQIILQS